MVGLSILALCVGLAGGFVRGVRTASMQPNLIWTVQYDGYG